MTTIQVERIIGMIHIVGEIMSRFYRKPKPETMKKNREEYAKHYAVEIKWMKKNVMTLSKHNKFLVDMYTILVTGSRKITPKMQLAIINGVYRCKNDPRYNDELRKEADEKLEPILSKINYIETLAKHKKVHSLGFIKNVKDFVKRNHKITRSQMEALNNVYKKLNKGNNDETE